MSGWDNDATTVCRRSWCSRRDCTARCPSLWAGLPWPLASQHVQHVPRCGRRVPPRVHGLCTADSHRVVQRVLRQVPGPVLVGRRCWPSGRREAPCVVPLASSVAPSMRQAQASDRPSEALAPGPTRRPRLASPSPLLCHQRHPAWPAASACARRQRGRRCPKNC